MLSLPRLLAVTLAGLLLVLLPSQTAATCNMNQLDGFFGNATSGTNGQQFQDNNWSLTSRPSRNQTYLNDNCRWNCSGDVVLSLSVETVRNEFMIIINGRVLQPSGQWQCEGFLCLSSLATGLWIGPTTLVPGTNRKFFTGNYNTPQNDPYYGNYVTTSGPMDGQYAPVYNVAFNAWLCPTTTIKNGRPVVNEATNTVIVKTRFRNWSIYTGSGGLYCSDAFLFTITRTCAANVKGDPQFKGLRGQDYQVHGIDGGIYNIISAPSYFINSEFVWLDGPRACPIIPSTGKKSVACFAHRGSYLKNLAFVTDSGAKVLVVSGDAEHGLSSVMINGKTLTVGKTVDASGAMVTYNSTHEVTVSIGSFDLEIENSDGFVNIRSLAVQPGQWPALQDGGVHGLLGQTWMRESTTKRVIEGRVDDYLVQSGDIFGTDHLYNRYQIDAVSDE